MNSQEGIPKIENMFAELWKSVERVREREREREKSACRDSLLLTEKYGLHLNSLLE
jgi:hypothetical protein